MSDRGSSVLGRTSVYSFTEVTSPTKPIQAEPTAPRPSELSNIQESRRPSPEIKAAASTVKESTLSKNVGGNTAPNSTPVKASPFSVSAPGPKMTIAMLARRLNEEKKREQARADDHKVKRYVY